MSYTVSGGVSLGWGILEGNRAHGKARDLRRLCVFRLEKLPAVRNSGGFPP